MLRGALVVVALLAGVCSVPAGAATAAPALTRTGQSVTWTGTLTTPDPLGCGEAVSYGCDTTSLTVVAPKGAWITVSTNGIQGFVRVTERGVTVGSNGYTYGTRTPITSTESTTFAQVRSGRVVYTVGVSSATASPASPVAYRGQARLAGKGFDRAGDCFVGDSGLAALQAADDGRLLRLSVRLVTAPADLAEVRRVVVPALVETYGRIDIALRVSVDAMPITGFETYPFEVPRRRYGGVRPPGVDVVHVLTDVFSGGVADCIGGIAYPEKAFSTGALHYGVEGRVRVPTVTAAVIAAHEIGHLLGGQHQMVSCVEALPQLALQPASDGSVGPCTVMGPVAAQDSETFGTVERASIRSYVRRFARG